MNSDEYDASQDDGTYTGTMTVYDGPGTDPSVVDRTCPDVSATLVVSQGSVVLTTVDTYPNYNDGGAFIKNHSASGQVFANNKFVLEDSWPFDETIQLTDLQSLEVCDSNLTTGSRGTLIDLAFRVDEPGFVGEFGNGIARGSLFYGVRCQRDVFLPLCLYFMELRKN